eukprot:11436017-Alexandrium_andersonii.AAC.1
MRRAAVGRKQRPHSEQGWGFALLLPSSHAIASKVSMAMHLGQLTLMRGSPPLRCGCMATARCEAICARWPRNQRSKVA